MRAPHRQDSTFQQWLQSVDVSTCYVCSLTWMELHTGVLKKRQKDPQQADILDAWFKAIHESFVARTISFDDAAATVTAPLWLMRSRGSIDTLLAGTALAHNLNLVTRNDADFADVPGLHVVNPWAPTT